ncbi:hypothetical protein EDB89DRAFT_2226906 [Lactarius sanguifluus]|nr:hypothetical protein EDB89DRAFT_2226906 [Lactarius sanguifluus]
MDNNFESGPPLKAVYRGAVAGIRYQYPFSTPATSPASYRRFQVNFASASDATQFIDAIRPVCPCKETAGPPAPPIPTNRPLVPPAAARSTLARYHTSAVQRPSMLPPSMSTVVSSTLKSETQGSSQEFPPRAPHFPPHPSSDLSLALSSSDPAPAVALPHPTPSLGYDRSSQPILRTAFQPVHGTERNPRRRPPPATQREDEPEEKRAREAFLESLREAPELYSLTRRELENLVSVVVREPGFPRLGVSFDLLRWRD